MRVLFTSTFGTGHVNPLIPLGHAALEAGHEVAFAAPPLLAGRLQRLGLAVLPTGLSPEDAAVQRVMAELRPTSGGPVGTTLGKLFTDTLAQHMLRVLPPVMDAFAPDVVVSEVLELAGPLLAEARGLPALAFVFGGAAPLTELAERIGDAWPRLRAAAGLEGDPRAALAKLPLLAASPATFAHPEIAALSPFHFRPGGGDAVAGAEVAWIDALEGGPTVYVTLGTAQASVAPGLLEALVARLAPVAKNLIVTCGPLRDPASLAGHGDHVRVEPYLPHSALLPRCDLVVAHAGYGTTMDCLRHGVPALLMPFSADQPMNAAAAERMGVSLTLPRDPSEVARVGELARRVLDDPGYAQSARAAAQQLAAMPGPEAAVELIAERARGAAPRPPRFADRGSP